MPKDKKSAPKKSAPKTESAPEKKKAKRPRVRLASKTLAGFWVRAYKDIIDEHGMPVGPDGQPLHVVVARGGMSAEERARRKAEKDAEKARFAAMSDEEKLAYAKAKREERKAKREAKKQREREELIAQIKAEIKAGNIKL